MYKVLSLNFIIKCLNKANPGELNKWICLLVHWDIVRSDQSSVWCNHKKSKTFTARVSRGNDKTTFAFGKH